MKRIVSILLLLCLLGALCAGCQKAVPAVKSTPPDPKTATYAVLVGTISEKIVDETYPDAVKMPFDSVSDAVLALLSGKADYVVTAYTNCVNFLRENPGKLVILPDKLTDEGNAIAVNPAETELRGEIDRVLDVFRQDGTLDEVIDHWIRADGSDYVREEIPVAADGAVLRVAVSAEREPLCFVENGEITGLDAELIRRIAYALHMRVEFSDMKFSAMIPSVLSGKTPVAISNIAATDERRQSVDFSSEYFVNPQMLLTRAEYGTSQTESGGDTSLPAPETARIGAQTGTSFESLAMERFPNAEYKSFSSLDSCMLSLKSGQIDYAVMANLDAQYHKEVDNGYCLLDPPLKEIKVCAAISKDKPELLTKVDELLIKYQEDGTLDRMYSNWYEVEGHNYIQEQIPILDQGETLRVVINSNNEPNAFIQDGVLCGYDIELLYRLANDMGMHVEFVDVETAAMVPTLAAGKGDMILCGLTWTEERAEKVLFSRPYITLSTVLAYYDSTKAGAAATESGDDNFWDALADSFRKNFIVENRWKLIVQGIGGTLLLSICSGLVGILIGFGFCLLRMGRVKALGASVSVLTRILQGTPIVVLLMILYYIVFNKTGLDGIAVSIIAFGLNFGAYASEIMLSGIHAVDSGQNEAAAAMGFTNAQTFRKIVFPQAARHFLPVLKGEYISLVKMTSIVGYVAVQDLTKVSDIIRSRTYEAFFPLIVTAILYFLLSFGLSSLLRLIEVRIDPKHRPRTLKGVEML